MKKREYIFLIIACVIGLLYVIILPIGVVPDEAHHYCRAYEISEGSFLSIKNEDGVGGNYLPKSINGIYQYGYDNSSKNNYDYLTRRNELRQDDEKIFYDFSNFSLYAPICHSPQAIGICIGRLLGLSVVDIAYLGRISNLLIWLCLVFFAIRYIPIYKNLLFALAIMPMSIQEAASLSSDAITNASILFFVAYVLYLKISTNTISVSSYIVLSLSVLLVSLCKIIYIPLIFLVLIIPSSKFITIKNKSIYCGLIIIIALIVNLLWLNIASSYLNGSSNVQANPDEQISYIIHNPFQYTYIMLKTLCVESVHYLSSFCGHIMGSLNVFIPMLYVVISGFALFGIGFMDSCNANYFTIKDKIFTTVLSFGVIVLMLTSLYVQWTAPQATSIGGVQGRYFIPIIIPLFLIFAHKLSNKTFINIVPKLLILCFIAIICVNIIDLYIIYNTCISW